MSTSTHPLLSALPLCRKIARENGGRCRVLRAAGQPYGLEVETPEDTVELVLDDIVKHRVSSFGMWVELDEGDDLRARLEVAS